MPSIPDIPDRDPAEICLAHAGVESDRPDRRARGTAGLLGLRHLRRGRPDLRRRDGGASRGTGGKSEGRGRARAQREEPAPAHRSAREQR
ncbi:hypothetical protein [Amycolatopsis taiwanensis]|uniref:hypothetical protein n=1 Tax=Amycolatopsis taiwanensis TaxID=342230 RepID=UPI00146FA511|nr:hypothetical protein [Amycolatopsis taiwanensis]